MILHRDTLRPVKRLTLKEIAEEYARIHKAMMERPGLKPRKPE
jgi:hypothetical protein